MSRRLALHVSCEHGGNQIPREYAHLFKGATEALSSHRGYDPGALDLAERIASRLKSPLHESRISRLLVDLNRSIGHPRLFSEVTRNLDPETKRRILESHYRPYRLSVIGGIDEILSREDRAFHLSVHTFTPRLHGRTRRVDVGLLYDPSRSKEVLLCQRWQQLLESCLPDLRIRRNNPYRGVQDGLVTALRRTYSPKRYLGVELEVNQRFVHSRPERWRSISEGITMSLEALLLRRPYRSHHPRYPNPTEGFRTPAMNASESTRISSMESAGSRKPRSVRN